MSEDELGKLAYEAFRNDHVDDRDPELFEWDEYSDIFKRHWIAAANAVAALYQHTLTEDRVREIVRDEIGKWEKNKVREMIRHGSPVRGAL